jgi:hypothetical protein
MAVVRFMFTAKKAALINEVSCDGLIDSPFLHQ